MKKIIHLDFADDQFGIIIKKKTRIWFSNQTGGVCCHQPEQEGVCIYVRSKKVAESLCDGFETCGEWSDKYSDVVDSILQLDPDTRGIIVDRDPKLESEEAWVHVIVNAPEPDVPFSSFSGFKNVKAILTWNNSD